jgi:hypothetical protein
LQGYDSYCPPQAPFSLESGQELAAFILLNKKNLTDLKALLPHNTFFLKSPRCLPLADKYLRAFLLHLLSVVSTCWFCLLYLTFFYYSFEENKRRKEQKNKIKTFQKANRNVRNDVSSRNQIYGGPC